MLCWGVTTVHFGFAYFNDLAVTICQRTNYVRQQQLGTLFERPNPPAPTPPTKEQQEVEQPKPPYPPLPPNTHTTKGAAHTPD